MAPAFNDDALILRTQNLKETDRIIIMLTREHGMIHAVAKGVRKPNSKFGARLEPFMHSSLALNTGRGSLHTVTQAVTVHPYSSAIVADYARFGCAALMVELGEKLCTDSPLEDTHPHFGLLHGALAALARGEHVPQRILTSYMMRALALAGWQIVSENCTVCGRNLLDDSRGAFHTAGVYGEFGLLCADHAAGVEVPLVRLPAPRLRLLLALSRGDWATVDPAAPAECAKLLDLVLTTTQNLLEAPLKTALTLESEA